MDSYSIEQMVIAGILPGLLAIVMHMITIWIIGVTRPGFLPAGPKSSWGDRLAAFRDVWSPLLLFLFEVQQWCRVSGAVATYMPTPSVAYVFALADTPVL